MPARNIGRNRSLRVALTGRKSSSRLASTIKKKKLREFHFKFIHRIVVTKKELFRFKLKEDGDCIYCGEADSIDHSLLIACSRNHSARKCCNGLMLLTSPPFHSVLRNCFLVWQTNLTFWRES